MAAKSQTILAFDPGKTNMAYAIHKKTGKKIEVLEFGMFKNTITDLKPQNLKDTVKDFNKAVVSLIKKYSVEEVSMERFISRGLLGSLAEYICIMQGIIAINKRVKIFNLVAAATWKNSFNKNYNLKQFYKDAKEHGIIVHEVDAILIGIYYIDKSLFAKFSSDRFRKQFLRKLQNVPSTWGTFYTPM